MIRTTYLVPTADRPSRLVAADPDQLVHQRFVARRGLAVPSRNANRLRGLLAGVGQRLAPLNPSIAQRCWNVPRAVRSSSRTVCTTVSRLSADLDQEVAVRPRRDQLVDRERRHRDQLPGPLRAEPVAVIEQRRAEADRHRERVGGVIRTQDARVRRGRVELEQRNRPPGGERSGAVAQRLQGASQRADRARSCRARRSWLVPGPGSGSRPGADHRTRPGSRGSTPMSPRRHRRTRLTARSAQWHERSWGARTRRP